MGSTSAKEAPVTKSVAVQTEINWRLPAGGANMSCTQGQSRARALPISPQPNAPIEIRNYPVGNNYEKAFIERFPEFGNSQNASSGTSINALVECDSRERVAKSSVPSGQNNVAIRECDSLPVYTVNTPPPATAYKGTNSSMPCCLKNAALQIDEPSNLTNGQMSCNYANENEGGRGMEYDCYDDSNVTPKEDPKDDNSTGKSVFRRPIIVVPSGVGYPPSSTEQKNAIRTDEPSNLEDEPMDYTYDDEKREGRGLRFDYYDYNNGKTEEDHKDGNAQSKCACQQPSIVVPSDGENGQRRRSSVVFEENKPIMIDRDEPKPQSCKDINWAELTKDLNSIREQFDQHAQYMAKLQCIINERCQDAEAPAAATYPPPAARERHPSELELQGKASSTCEFCCEKAMPICDRDLFGQVLNLIGPRCLNEVVLTLLLRADNVYHVNVRELESGAVLGCVLVSDPAIGEAIDRRMFQQIASVCVIDVRSTLEPRECAFDLTFECVREKRQQGGKADEQDNMRAFQSKWAVHKEAETISSFPGVYQSPTQGSLIVKQRSCANRVLNRFACINGSFVSIASDDDDENDYRCCWAAARSRSILRRRE